MHDHFGSKLLNENAVKKESMSSVMAYIPINFRPRFFGQVLSTYFGRKLLDCNGKAPYLRIYICTYVGLCMACTAILPKNIEVLNLSVCLCVRTNVRRKKHTIFDKNYPWTNKTPQYNTHTLTACYIPNILLTFCLFVSPLSQFRTYKANKTTNVCNIYARF